MTVLALPERPLIEQIAAVERGLPGRALAEVAEELGLSQSRVIKGLNLAQRTVTAHQKGRRLLSALESERLYRLIRVIAQLRQVFTTNAAAAEWITAPAAGVGNRAPLDLLATDLGAQKVESLIRAMIHGVPR